MRATVKHGLLAAILALAACSDDSTSPGDAPFGVLIRVRDSSGRPVPNLRVSGWDKVPCEVTRNLCWWDTLTSTPQSNANIGGQSFISVPAPNPFWQTTRWQFSVSETSSVRIAIFDLDGTHVHTLLDTEIPAGSHDVEWDGRPYPRSSALYEVRYDVWTPGHGSLTYQDTVYAALYIDDPQQESSILGFTDEEGVVRTDDQLRFPFLRTYPTLSATDLSGGFIGNFVFLDTLVVVVSDTTKDISRAYEYGLSTRGNEIDLNWE
jgi:hypothetical protein